MLAILVIVSYREVGKRNKYVSRESDRLVDALLTKLNMHELIDIYDTEE